MRKLRLELDDLRVATFEITAEIVEPRGTVEGHAVAPTYPPLCPRSLYPTCQFQCTIGCD